MLIHNYNTTFRRIEKTDLETIRYWRNSIEINQFMEYREYITPEMQLKWFENINNLNNHYFIIEYASQTIGLVNCKDMNLPERKFEVGIYIFDTNFRNDIIFPISSLVICEAFVDFFNINIIETHVLKTNETFSKMLLKLGYKLRSDQEGLFNQKYFIENPELSKTFNYLRSYLSKWYKRKQKTEIVFNRNEFPHLKNFFTKSYNFMPKELKEKYIIKQKSSSKNMLRIFL
jgi:UDP-4-amino-4,6-dideoxy-N-acetyl-beta-L-altrosamine N-acetyltransferase